MTFAFQLVQRTCISKIHNQRIVQLHRLNKPSISSWDIHFYPLRLSLHIFDAPKVQQNAWASNDISTTDDLIIYKTTQRFQWRPRSKHRTIELYTFDRLLFQICKLLKAGATKHYEPEQKVPYLSQGDLWVGYDDENSLKLKVIPILSSLSNQYSLW